MQIVGSNQLEVWKQSENASSTTSQNFVAITKLCLPSTKVTFLVKIHCKKTRALQIQAHYTIFNPYILFNTYDVAPTCINTLTYICFKQHKQNLNKGYNFE